MKIFNAGKSSTIGTDLTLDVSGVVAANAGELIADDERRDGVPDFVEIIPSPPPL